MSIDNSALCWVFQFHPATCDFRTTLSKTELRSISQKQKGLKRRSEVVVRWSHTHVGAPDNRIIWFSNGTCPDAPGQRHGPGTWTRGRHLTKKQFTTFLNFSTTLQRLFFSGSTYSSKIGCIKFAQIFREIKSRIAEDELEIDRRLWRNLARLALYLADKRSAISMKNGLSADPNDLTMF